MKTAKGRRLSSSSSPFFFYLLVWLISIFSFSNTLYGEFVFDDEPAIVSNPDVDGSSSLQDLFLHDFWGNDVRLPGSHKSYRPLTTISFRLTHRFFGFSPIAFHLLNVILHSMVSCLVLWLANRLQTSKSEVFPLAVGLLFAVHPIHCDAVSSIVGRADVLSAFFCLLGLFFWDRYQNVLITVIFTILALFSKEIGLVLPLVVISFDLLVRRQTISLRHFVLLLFFFFLLRMRITFTGHPTFSSADNPLIYEKSLFTNVATRTYLCVFHLKLLIFPKNLCFDWSMEAIPLVSSPFDIRFSISIGILTFALFYVQNIWKKKQLTRLFYVLFGCMTFLPSSNILINVGFLAAERILYLPSIPFCILFIVILEEIVKKFNLSLHHLFSIIFLICFCRTIERNKDWTTAENLYSSAVHLNPSKAYSNLGLVLASKGRIEEATRMYELALQNRQSADTFYNLGVLQSSLGNHSLAIQSYSRAVNIRKTFTSAYLNMGISLIKQKEIFEAEKVFNACIETSIGNLKNRRAHWKAQQACHFHRANLYRASNNMQKAKKDYLQVVEKTINPIAMTSLAEVEIMLGEKQGGERLRKVLKKYPNHIPAIILFSRYLTAKGNVDNAERFLRHSLMNLPNCHRCAKELAILTTKKSWKDKGKIIDSRRTLNVKKKMNETKKQEN